MKKFLKYGIVPAGTIIFLFVLTVILLPVVIDVQKLVPAFEQRMSKVTGRDFSIGSNVSVSFFPWLSISFSDLELGNPDGFSKEKSLTVESFEGRIQLLPLLIGNISVDRFVLGGVKINVETRKDGAVNWNLTPEDLEKRLGDVKMDLFAVTDGSITWTDRRGAVENKRVAEDFMVLANDFRLDKSFLLDAKATIDGRSITLNGEVGPYSPGDESAINYMLNFDFAEVIQGKLKGNIGFAPLKMNMETTVEPFVPARLVSVLGEAAAGKESFLNDVKSAAVKANIIGTGDSFLLQKGRASLDYSNIDFNASYKANNANKIVVDMSVDKFVFPKGSGTGNSALQENVTFLADLLGATELHMKLACKQLLVRDAVATDFDAAVSGKDRIFDFSPVSFSMYGGRATAKSRVNLTTETPDTSIALRFSDVQIASLLKGLFDVDLFAGTGSVESSVNFSGLDRASVMASLAGRAEITVSDGSLAGFDLIDIYSGGKSQFVGFAPGIVHDIRTAFSKLNMTINSANGQVDLADAKIELAGVTADLTGNADFNENRMRLQFVNPVSQVEDSATQPVLVISSPVTLTGNLDKPQLLVGDTVIPQNGVLVANAVEVDNLVSGKVPMPEDENMKGMVGKTLVDPLVIAERMGLALPTYKKLPDVDEPSVSIDNVSRIRIHPLRHELTM